MPRVEADVLDALRALGYGSNRDGPAYGPQQVWQDRAKQLSAHRRIEDWMHVEAALRAL